MGVCTGVEYLERLRDGREVWIEGERVKDVTAHAGLKRGAQTMARLLDRERVSAGASSSSSSSGASSSGAAAIPSSAACGKCLLGWPFCSSLKYSLESGSEAQEFGISTNLVIPINIVDHHILVVIFQTVKSI